MKTKTAIHILLGITAAVIIMHILIVSSVIPYTNVWGGRLKSREEMLFFEVFSLLINLFFIYILMLRGGYLKGRLSPKAIQIILWIYFLLFVLNTIGNLAAVTNFEKYFSLLTALLAFLIFRVIRGDTRDERLETKDKR